jgi:putative transposase
LRDKWNWHFGIWLEDGASTGSKTNQKFVQIPTAKLKARISQLCEQYGIQFVETEESYTSKASFLDSDSLPKHGENPSGGKNQAEDLLAACTKVGKESG